MGRRGLAWILLAFLILSIALTVAVIPGVGIETRGTSAFPSWQNMLFTDGGPIALILAVVAAITVLPWNRVGASLGILSGLLALILSIIGLAGFGAAVAPTGVIASDVVHLLVAIGIIAVGAGVLSSRPPSPAPTPPAP